MEKPTVLPRSQVLGRGKQSETRFPEPRVGPCPLRGGQGPGGKKKTRNAGPPKPCSKVEHRHKSSTGTGSRKVGHRSRHHDGLVHPGGGGSRHRALSSDVPEGGLASHTLQLSAYQVFFVHLEMLRAVYPSSRAKDDDRESRLLENIPIPRCVCGGVHPPLRASALMRRPESAGVSHISATMRPMQPRRRRSYESPRATAPLAWLQPSPVGVWCRQR